MSRTVARCEHGVALVHVADDEAPGVDVSKTDARLRAARTRKSQRARETRLFRGL